MQPSRRHGSLRVFTRRARIHSCAGRLPAPAPAHTHAPLEAPAAKRLSASSARKPSQPLHALPRDGAGAARPVGRRAATASFAAARPAAVDAAPGAQELAGRGRRGRAAAAQERDQPHARADRLRPHQGLGALPHQAFQPRPQARAGGLRPRAARAAARQVLAPEGARLP